GVERGIAAERRARLRESGGLRRLLPQRERRGRHDAQCRETCEEGKSHAVFREYTLFSVSLADHAAAVITNSARRAADGRCFGLSTSAEATASNTRRRSGSKFAVSARWCFGGRPVRRSQSVAPS